MQKFIVITDGPFAGSGFSEEMRNILFRLVQTGDFEAIWYSLQHTGFPYPLHDSVFEDIPHKASQIRVVGHRPHNKFTFGAEQFVMHWKKENPEFVLFMGDPKNIRSYVYGRLGDDNKAAGSLKQRLGFPLYMYVTLDGLPVHPKWMDYLRHVNVLIAMTEWAQVEYSKTGLAPAFIHHGVNWNLWATNDRERIALRKKWKIPLDCTLAITWDVPQHRKRTDALLRAWKLAKPDKKKMKLLIYSDWDLGGSLGYDIEGLIKQYDIPRETIISPLQLQGYPKEWECPESPERIREVAKLGDFYVSATSGEGFGKCLLEAMTLMPVIAPDYSAVSEVCQKGSILVPITGTYRPDDARRSVEGALVDEKALAHAIEELYYNQAKRAELREEAREWSRNFDYDTMIVPQWINLLNSINPDEIMQRELLEL